MNPDEFNPATDLLLERVVPVPLQRVWDAWTKPEHLKQWFCPRPWTVPSCEIDLRPGGAFVTTMRGPDGEEFTTHGSFLEVVPLHRLVWTDALTAGFRPSDRGFLTTDGGFYVTGVITMTAEGNGTRYHAWARHADTASRDKHAAMGFAQGWGAALDQLVELWRTPE